MAELSSLLEQGPESGDHRLGSRFGRAPPPEGTSSKWCRYCNALLHLSAAAAEVAPMLLLAQLLPIVGWAWQLSPLPACSLAGTLVRRYASASSEREETINARSGSRVQGVETWLELDSEDDDPSLSAAPAASRGRWCRNLPWRPLSAALIHLGCWLVLRVAFSLLDGTGVFFVEIDGTMAVDYVGLHRMLQTLMLLQFVVGVLYAFDACAACSKSPARQQNSCLRWLTIAAPFALELAVLAYCAVDGLRWHGTEKMRVVKGSAKCSLLAWPQSEDSCGWTPFPSNEFTKPDTETETGLRVNLPADLLCVKKGCIDPGTWNQHDGFSTTAALSFTMDGPLDSSRLTGLENIGRSLTNASSTVIFMVGEEDEGEETLTQHPHWAEIDSAFRQQQQGGGEASDWVLLQLATPLQPARRYIVAVIGGQEGLRSTTGPLTPRRAMLELLAGKGLQAAPLQTYYEEKIFKPLEHAGIRRDTLLLAWDFTTRSWTGHQEAVAAAQADAIERVTGSRNGVGAYSITADMNYERHCSESDAGAHGAMRQLFFGQVELPCYLEDCSPYGRRFAALRRDGENIVYSGTTSVGFVLVIPCGVSDLNNVSRLVQVGHGLFNNRHEVYDQDVIDLCTQHGWVAFGADTFGMSRLDLPAVVGVLGYDLARASAMADRVLQGHLQNLALGTWIQQMLKTTKVFGGMRRRSVDDLPMTYYGNSQGGLTGGALFAMSGEHFESAVLGVTGIPFSTLLPRSVDFISGYRPILMEQVFDFGDLLLALALLQQFLDFVLIDGWTHALLGRKVFLNAGVADPEVSNVGTWTLARSLNASIVAPSPWPDWLWGLPVRPAAEIHGVALTGWTFPDAPLSALPEQDVPPTGGNPHMCVRNQQPLIQQEVAYIRTGQVQQVCDDGKTCRADGCW
eukprot:TRINITY_DN27164_c0_g1_i2.p1 TRINITY_DN27164_c0_g1~~TRINITY_DN27164_c0_g1_i2.p1  ORF type:complete len:909 (-),score=182.48 TRINITY_DN27164_c0_g1_i2:417-3143(-)